MIFLILLILLFPAWAEAATYWASVGGGAASCAAASGASDPGVYRTFAQGLACPSAGDTLMIKGGTYPDNNGVLPNSGTSFANAITIRNAPGETVTFSGNHPIDVYSGSFHHVIVDGSDGNNIPCSIGNCTTRIVYDGALGAGGIVTNLSTYIRFKGIEIKNMAENGYQPGSTNSEGHEIINSRVHNNGRLIISGTPQEHGMYNNSRSGIIDGNDIYSNCGAGIHSYSADYPNINQNMIIRNNRVRNNGTCGPMHAIVVTQGPNIRIYNNLVHNNNGNGITIYNIGADGTQVYNNTVYSNNGNGLYLYGGAATGTIWRNNISENNSGSNFNLEGGSATYSNNLCSTAITGCMTATESPTTTFTNAAAGNFTLSGASTAANNGGANLGSSYSPDIAGVARPASGAWEIGAYEYAAGLPAVNQLVLALPLDEGSGSIAVDVSGQKNNANLIGGATWIASRTGFGQAIQLDGSGYVNIPASASLALSSGMTLEAWIYPTALAGFVAVIRHDLYYLYAASGAGVCPSPPLAPFGGYSSAAGLNSLCATSLPPLNQWSHIALTYDGSTQFFYLNGNPIASQSSTEPMTSGSANVTIGASTFGVVGDQFIGRIDQPMIYTYARTQAQIVSDMNTPLIGPPGKYVEIAAPTSIEISSASSIEIAAD